MGFFSFLTADTKKSISNVYSGKPVKPVYLLQPDGKDPIHEPAYEGYGVFGGVDAYVWLLQNNAASLDIDISNITEEKMRMLGVGLSVGRVMRDTETQKIWCIFQDYSDLLHDAKFFRLDYGTVIPELGSSANDLRESGRFEDVYIRDILKIARPLKFSFSPDAVYENLPASKNCPKQGYFYE